MGSGIGEGQGDLSILRRDATQKRGYGTGHEKPLSWGTEDRQDLPRTTYSKGSPGRGTITDKGKDTGHPSLLGWSGGSVTGVIEDEGKMRVEVVKESLHSFVVHSFYKYLLIIMIC